MRLQRHPLLSPSLGTQRELLSFHYGPVGQGEKIYLQASLHADELPGMLVLHHLKPMLAQAEERGLLLGEVVVVPVANPIGLSQTLLHDQMGRFEFASGENFNRRYPDFFGQLHTGLATQLGKDPEQNKQWVRQSMRNWLAQQQACTELDSLRHTLVSLAFDADVVLDLHCDFDAALHLYTETPYQEQGQILGRYLGARALLVAKGSGGQSFDEAMSGVWWQLQEHFGPAQPVPLGCFAATVELRGEADVGHAYAQQDAAALYAYLQHRGVIAGSAQALPAAQCQPTPLAGSETLKAPQAGVLAYLKQIGDYVQAGEVVVEVIDPLHDRVAAVTASVSGVFYARSNLRYATLGMDLGKIAGSVPFRSGYLLTA